MSEIISRSGTIILVDKSDLPLLTLYKWRTYPHHNTWYAETRINKTNVYMHRMILGLRPNDGIQVDHINGNGLDNRHQNLRMATPAQNQHNQKKLRGGTSKYKGVDWDTTYGKWHARIKYNKRRIHLGYFTNEIEAAKCYDRSAKELFGEFAHPNFLG